MECVHQWVATMRTNESDRFEKCGCVPAHAMCALHFASASTELKGAFLFEGC